MKKCFFLLFFAVMGLSACHLKTAEEEGNDPNSALRKNRAAEMNTQLGIGYLRQGDRGRAKKKLLYALQLSPHSASANSAMGFYMEQTGDFSDAEKYYKNALNYSNHSGAQLNNFGTFLCRRGQYKDAEQYFLRAVKDVNYINSAGAYENAGLCAEAIADDIKAKKYFTKALEQDPDRKQSLKELLVIVDKQHNTKAMLDIIEQHASLVYNDTKLLKQAMELAKTEHKNELADFYQNRLYMVNKLASQNLGAKNEHSNG